MKTAIYGVWHVHAPGYTKTAQEYGEVVGFYERNDKLAEDFAKQFNIPRFNTPEELLASDAEGVNQAISLMNEALKALISYQEK